MKQYFLKNSLSLISQYNTQYTASELDKIRYGLEGLYLTITKAVVILIIALLLGCVKETLLLILLFNIIRYPGFGAHANSSLVCLISSLLLFIGLPYLLMQLTIPIPVAITIIALTFISFILYAPADTAKRPLRNATKRKIFKIATLGIAIVYTCGYFLINNHALQSILLTALIMEAILIHPLFYKLLKLSYRNYKTEKSIS